LADGAVEEVFVKERECDEGQMDQLLREVALEAATCATLAPLACFLEIRAVQVMDESCLMAFRKLQGRSFCDLLDSMEARRRKGRESEILGGVLLALGAYMKLTMVGYCQRDAKSGNLWLSYSAESPQLRVVVIDSDACFKVGHISDAFDAGVSSEAWQLEALRGERVWKFGGTTYSKAVSMHTANVDMLSKQSLPGEQAIVFSLSELFLRMMGQADQAWACADEACWEDVLESSVYCDLLGEGSGEDEDGPPAPARRSTGWETSSSSTATPAS